jgi:hypothetical protein
MRLTTWKYIAACGCLLALVLVAGPAWAQDQAAIAGDVTDATDAALPGVTVVVASPALIERTRTAVTDGTGNYQIISLRPGTYSVTFSLDGFNTVRREGVVLSGAFTAPVDATLPVGDLNESVTVTTAAPLVDVVSTRQQTVLTADRINALPQAAGLYWAGEYVPGTQFVFGMPILHGSEQADSQPAYNGVKSGTQLIGRGEWPGASVGAVENEASIAELAFDTSSQSAEFAQSGVRTNIIPKAGGNNFSFDIFASGTTERFQSDNQSSELKAPPYNFQFAPNAHIWDFNPAVGGPILKDKLWFFASISEYRNKNYFLDQFFDPAEPSTPEGLGGDLRVFNNNKQRQQSLRLTNQVTQRNKLMFSTINQLDRNDRVAFHPALGPFDAEAAFALYQDPVYMFIGRWTAPLTNRMLVEADVSLQRTSLRYGGMDHGGEIRMPLNDLALGRIYSTTNLAADNKDYRRHLNASVSYVTGSHNFKAGLNYQNNTTHDSYNAPGGVYSGYTFGGWPSFLFLAGPDDSRMNINCDCGLYVQDAWTMDRLTLNGGFRYDWFNSSVRGGNFPAGIWTSAVSLPDPVAENVPDWKNFNGRFGAAYDVFGDGRTAVKASAGRYVASEATSVSAVFNPIAWYNLDYRSWSDLNGDGTMLNTDGTPQFDEVGPSYNPNWGTSNLSTTLNPDLGRGTNWEYSAGVEHQLSSGWAISGMWHHRTYGNHRWTDNLNTSAGDWVMAGTFTGPSDATLPESARGRTIDVYNVQPGLTILGGNSDLTRAPEDKRTWNGFEVILDGELPRGGFMTASVTAGKSSDHFCQGGVSENPNLLLNCDITSPYRPMGKLSGGVPLPWDTMISGLFQVFPGIPIDATYAMNSADFPGLFFGLNNAAPVLTYNLIEPYTEFEDYTTNLQLRFSKVIRLGNVRTRVYMDATNIFNQARVTARNSFFGGGGITNPDYRRLTEIEPGRTLTFGLQSSF